LSHPNFTKTIAEKGGNRSCQAMATEALTKEVMGCTSQELYEQTGGKVNQRETLPERDREALMTGEIVATYGSQISMDSGTIATSNKWRNCRFGSRFGKKVRKLFPW
jgi:hypothetical protein